MSCFSCCRRLVRPAADSAPAMKQLWKANMRTSNFSTSTPLSSTFALGRQLSPPSLLRTPTTTRLPLLSLSLTRPSLISPPTTSPINPPTNLPTIRAFSTTAPALAPRNTFNPSHRVRKRRHGFLSRIRTRKGRNTLMRRRQKGRQNMSH